MDRKTSVSSCPVLLTTDATCRNWFAVIVAIAVGIRLGGAWLLNHPLDSDPFAYFTMAAGLADHGELLDMYGQHAFYSAGYPLLLAPFFMILGSSVAVALWVNMLLCVVSIWLIYRLTLALSDDRAAGLIASAAYAMWFPGIWNATMLAKENLSTPLLLGMALCAIGVARDQRANVNALLAGLLWGAALVTGGSAMLLCAGVGVALVTLWRVYGRFTAAVKGGLAFFAGAALMLAPWLYATNEMVGRPVLTTNAAFNLYLGNNPAATGRFVSIADTPLGKTWQEDRQRLGEGGNAERLQAEAINWIAANPDRAAELALVKLAYFWQPNIPDGADFNASKVMASIRVVEVAQFGLIVLLGLFAFRSPLVSNDGKWIFAAMITGFWLIHAAAYIITRYRDPVIPLLIIMAAIPVSAWLQPIWAGKDKPHVA